MGMARRILAPPFSPSLSVPLPSPVYEAEAWRAGGRHGLDGQDALG